MAKIDLKKQFSDLYKASAGQPALVDVPPMKFLMVDGAGDPDGSAAFQDAIGALYGASYTMKFARLEGCRPCGKHHEIYMGDPRRLPPEKWKTILRQPVSRS